jgi:hypothetical protein
VSLTPLTESVYSDGAILPGPKYLLRMSICNEENSALQIRNSLGSGRHILVGEKSQPQQDVTGAIMRLAESLNVSTMPRVEWSGLQGNLVLDTSLRIYILYWHSVSWSPIKFMTQLNNSLV